MIREGLAAGCHPDFVVATPEFIANPASQDLVEALGASVSPVDPRLLDELTDADSPRGILAVVSLADQDLASVPIADDGVYLYLDGIQDPGNYGALVRAAEGLGATAVVAAPGCTQPNHPRALRASAGSLLRVRPVVDATVAELSEHLQPVSPTIVALVPRGGIPLRDLPFAGTQVLAVGAEGPGLSAAVLQLADQRVTIPLISPVESLNAAVAAALVLYECRRRGGH